MTDHGTPSGAPGPAHEEDLLGPELRGILGSLPRELAPERDLAADIASRTWDSLIVDAGTHVAGATGRRPARAAWWARPRVQLAAAAAALIIVTSVTTTFIVRGQLDTDAPTTSVTATDNRGGYRLAAFRGIERDYAEAIDDLTEALDAQRYRLPPETVALIEENLRIIDAAIEASVAALEEAPQSVPLQQAVTTSYETKLDFLRRAAAITADG
jgi:hypothetical protein